jgi:hypothetical protein
MFFQELVEQHRVHRLVEHRVSFSASVAGHETGIDLSTSPATRLNC